ncbi:MAG: amidohydrolase family protein [Actinophytocola sp.]|uniref:amidohydrolase family protein n=1 Tax=Actinophytocola sp. TaxID=1872138 RepID=UPI003D6B43E2
MTALHLRGVVLPEGEERDLWIVNGRIRAEAVPGAETIVDGGYLVPGLVDAHCHIGLAVEDLDGAAQQAEQDRDAGTLLIRDCGSPLDTSPLQERLDLPRIVRAGRHIARPKRYIRGIAEEVDPHDLPRIVAEQAAAGDGWVKLVGDYIDRDLGELAPLWPDDILAEAMKVAHEAGARVTAHVFGPDALAGLIDAGIDCIEHGTGLTDDTIAAMVEHGTALVPTLINIETFPGIAAAGAGKFPRYADQMLDLHARVRPTVRYAIEAGIPVYAGTDAGGGIAHGRIVDEIIALHEAGMTTEQALGAASWTARGWLGWSGIQESSAADIVAYAEDPRVDLNALRHPTRMILRGRVLH